MDLLTGNSPRLVERLNMMVEANLNHAKKLSWLDRRTYIKDLRSLKLLDLITLIEGGHSYQQPFPQSAVQTRLGEKSSVGHDPRTRPQESGMATPTPKQESNPSLNVQDKARCPNCGGPGSNGACWSCGARW